MLSATGQWQVSARQQVMLDSIPADIVELMRDYYQYDEKLNLYPMGIGDALKGEKRARTIKWRKMYYSLQDLFGENGAIDRMNLGLLWFPRLYKW